MQSRANVYLLLALERVILATNSYQKRFQQPQQQKGPKARSTASWPLARRIESPELLDGGPSALACLPITEQKRWETSLEALLKVRRSESKWEERKG